MKLLVFAHRLELGGTQVNAIELASELRDGHGFDVVFHATEGPALGLVREAGLRYVPAPDARLHPSPARMRALRALVREESPDLIHVWDWWQALEAYWAVHVTQGVPLIVTDMMMDITRALPRGVPTTFGYEGFRRKAERAGWRQAHLLLPPVDTRVNAPGVVAEEGAALRERYGIGDGEQLVVSVSRLAEIMKSESLTRAISVMSRIGRDRPVRLLIVGDGAARPRLEKLARGTNRLLGREAVILAGPMVDPRPAYAAADVVLGMGGSALRALAFGKPLVVTGEGGFARLFSSWNASSFEETGMFGRVVPATGDDLLEDSLVAVLDDPALRAELAAFGRDYVVKRHGLEGVARTFAELCLEAADHRPDRLATAGDALRTAYYYLRERRFRIASRDRLPAPPPDPGRRVLRPD